MTYFKYQVSIKKFFVATMFSFFYNTLLTPYTTNAKLYIMYTMLCARVCVITSKVLLLAWLNIFIALMCDKFSF